MLNIDLEVVLQVLAYSRQLMHRSNANFLQLIAIANARYLQQLWRVKRSTAQNNFLRPHRALATKWQFVLNARCSFSVGKNLRDERATLHSQILAMLHRMQICARCAVPTTTLHVAIECREPFLLITVYVLRNWMASLLHCFEESTEQWIFYSTTLHMQRTRFSTELVRIICSNARLHFLEVRQTMCVVPLAHSWVGSPAFIVQRIAALKNHAVNAGRTAENFSSTVRNATTIHMWFWL